MSRQSVHNGFPTALLTFSAMLLVLALGFVVGRVFVARQYMNSAPKFDSASDTGSELDGSSGAPGHVYVPKPPSSPREHARKEEDKPDTPATQEAAPGETPVRPTELPPAATEPSVEGVREETTPTPEPREEPASGKTYAIQVGVFTMKEGARQASDELSRAGYPGRITPEKRGSQDVYKVLTGRYQNEYAARKALDQLRASGFEAFLVER
jgi:cell division protein FtsN